MTADQAQQLEKMAAPEKSSRVRMAADRVRGGYLRVSGLRVSGSGSSFHLRICDFGYPKHFGFGADSRFNPRSSIGAPKLGPVKAHLATLAI